MIPDACLDPTTPEGAEFLAARRAYKEAVARLAREHPNPGLRAAQERLHRATLAWQQAHQHPPHLTR